MPARPKRATIRDVADETGLSPAAVSYAMRGLQVSSATEQRVREAADRLGYEADPIARALRAGRTGIVGLIVGSLADFWHQELVAAVQREVRLSGRHALVADADGEPALEIELAGRLVDQRVDGLIVAPVGPTSEAWGEVARAVPTVAIGDALPGAEPAGEVVFDVERGVGDTLRHLQWLGHRRIVVLSWAVEAAPDRPTERYVAEWAERLGLECRVVPCAYSLNGSRPLAVELLREADRPTAVFCLSDSIAYGVYAACRELELRVGRDVSVAGFDDHPISRLLEPALTSTGWDTDRIAASAMRFLSEALEGQDGPRHEVVPPTLAARASTAPPPA